LDKLDAAQDDFVHYKPDGILFDMDGYVSIECIFGADLLQCIG